MSALRTAAAIQFPGRTIASSSSLSSIWYRSGATRTGTQISQKSYAWRTWTRDFVWRGRGEHPSTTTSSSLLSIHKSSEIFPRETMRPSLHLHTLIHRASELRALSRQKQNFERSAGNFISRPSTITALQSVLSIPRYDGIIIAFHIFIHAIHRASGPLRNFD